MPSPETEDRPLSNSHRKQLLEIAEASIRHGLTEGHALPVNTEEYPEEFRQRRACFVTLNRNGDLRGCIGHLEAVQPLVADIAENAYAAAFHDPRFPRLSERELVDLDIHISILTPARPLEFSSQQDLIRRLRPGIDGLILEDGTRRGTFLPSVWESLPDPRSFLAHLKLKAGLPAGYWSDSITIYRYETESFSADELG
jgi:AmmeMemoRadiSam system protein A